MAAEQKKDQNKEHKKFYRHLTRRVHHDRYFAYAIALLIFAGVALVGYVVVVGNRFSTDASFVTLAQPNKVYINSQQGYSVSYPRTWVLDPEGAYYGTMEFENPSSSQEFISVLTLTAQQVAIVRSEQHINSETDFTNKNGAAVQLLTVSDSVKGSKPGEFDVMPSTVAFVSAYGKTFYVSGASPDLSAFLDSFKITP